MADQEERGKFIEELFDKGYAYKEILIALNNIHGIRISMRQLKRDLARLGLFRRRSNTPYHVLYNVVKYEIEKSGSALGYRNLHQKLKTIYRIQVSREQVRQLQHIIDPDGVAERKARRLQRRRYVCKGPNQVWHLDGYDKLKQFGFCIHGCIDGFSRKLLWLDVAGTNNCPKAVAHYFLKYVTEVGGAPRLVRADHGNENLNIAAMQIFFRRNNNDSLAGEKSFRFGKSVNNQRIEAFWSQLKRSHAIWWINFLKDMEYTGLWDSTDNIHKECLKFCFNGVIQQELDDFKKVHNTHRIRKYPNQECPNGRPDFIYTVPENYGTFDHKVDVSAAYLSVAESYTLPKPDFTGDTEFEKLALQIMLNENLLFPNSPEDAKILYTQLISYIDNL